MDTAKIVVPVRYSAWLAGDLGDQVKTMLTNELSALPGLRITLLPRAILVDAEEDPGPLLEATARAAKRMDAGAAKAYPVFHHEIGPVWTGTLQAVFAGPTLPPGHIGAPVASVSA